MSTQTPPPPGGEPPPRRLVRGPDGMVGGVAAGLADYFGIDPVIVRLLFVGFAFFGGTGLVAYVLLWIILPDARTQPPQPPRQEEPFPPMEWFRAQSDGTQVAVIIGGSLLLVLFMSGVFSPWPYSGFMWAIPLLAIGLLLMSDRWRGPGSESGDVHSDPATGRGNDHPTDDLSAPSASPTPSASWAPHSTGHAQNLTETDPTDTDPTEAGPPEPGPTEADATWGGPSWPEPPTSGGASPSAGSPAPPPREKSVLGQLTLAVMLIALGVGVALQNLGLVDLQTRDYLAAALVILGAGLLVGSVAGRARWLALIGVALLPFLMTAQLFGSFGAGAPGDGPFRSWSVGDVNVTPASVAEIEPYRYGVGVVDVDLRALDFSETDEPVEVRVSNAVGQTVVRVPDNVDVEATGSTFLGEIEIGNRARSGFGVQLEATEDRVNEVGTVMIDIDQMIGQAQILLD